MPRVTTAFVSDFQRDRVHRSDFYRGESRRYRAEFRGVLPEGVYVASSRWHCLNPSVTIMSDITGDYTGTDITLTLGYAGIGAMTCTVVLTNGDVVNQQFVVACNPSPWYTGDVVPAQGPTQLTVTNRTPIVTVLGDLVNGYAGDVVSYQYSAMGGDPPYTYTISSGALPAGLSMSGTGLVTGTRTTTGSYSFVVRAMDTQVHIGNKSDDSVTASAPLPPLTGNTLLYSALGNTGNNVGNDYQRGNWYFLVADQDTSTGINRFYVNGAYLGQMTGQIFDPPRAYPMTVGNTTNSNLALSGFTGMIWGAGVMNGGITDSEVSYLYNAGMGKSFSSLSVAPDAQGQSIWSRMFNAWQLNEPAGSTVYADQKGNANLTKTGNVGSYLDFQKGPVAVFTRSGVLKSELYGPSPHRTLMAWVYTQTPSGQEMIIGNYDAVSEGKAIFSNFVS
jgi:hypothetical protein